MTSTVRRNRNRKAGERIPGRDRGDDGEDRAADRDESELTIHWRKTARFSAPPNRRQLVPAVDRVGPGDVAESEESAGAVGQALVPTEGDEDESDDGEDECDGHQAHRRDAGDPARAPLPSSDDVVGLAVEARCARHYFSSSPNRPLRNTMISPIARVMTRMTSDIAAAAGKLLPENANQKPS